MMGLPWTWIAAVAVLGSIVAWGGYEKVRADHVAAEYADYRAKVAQAAQAASEQALKKTIADEKRKEEADAETLHLRSQLAATARRLRDARAASSILPPAASDSPDPTVACFDRPILDRALRQLDADLSGIIEEGAAAVVDLDTAKRWAKDR